MITYFDYIISVFQRIFSPKMFDLEAAMKKVSKAILNLMNEKLDEYMEVYFGNEPYKGVILYDLERQICWMAEDLGLHQSYFKKTVKSRIRKMKYENDCILERNYLSNLSVSAKPFVPLHPPLPPNPPSESLIRYKDKEETFDTSYLDSLLRLD